MATTGRYFTLDYDAERAPATISEPKVIKKQFFATVQQALDYVRHTLKMRVSWFWLNQYIGDGDNPQDEDEREATCYLDEAEDGGYTDLNLML